MAPLLDGKMVSTGFASLEALAVVKTSQWTHLVHTPSIQ
jgi:hypothetical protein